MYIYTLVYTLNSLCKKLGKMNGVTHVFLWSFHSYTQFLHGDACSVISLTPRGEKWLSKLRKNNLVYGLKQHQICKLIFSKHHICTLYKFVFFSYKHRPERCEVQCLVYYKQQAGKVFLIAVFRLSPPVIHVLTVRAQFLLLLLLWCVKICPLTKPVVMKKC